MSSKSSLTLQIVCGIQDKGILILEVFFFMKHFLNVKNYYANTTKFRYVGAILKYTETDVYFNYTLLIPEVADSGSNSDGIIYFRQKCRETTLNK